MIEPLAFLAAWTHPFDPEIFRVGPIAIRWYGLLFAGAILAGYWQLRKQFEKAGDDVEDAERLFLILFLCVVIGARLGHALFYQPELLHPTKIYRIWEGGLASHGATIAVLFGIWLGARRIGTDYLTISDRLAGGVALGSSFVRLGNFFNSEIVGRVTDVPWAVEFVRYDSKPRHPSQIYEFAIGITIWLALLGADRVYGVRRRPRGLNTFLFLALYFSMRFGVEYFKEFQVEEFERESPFTMGQWLSIPFLLVGWIGVAWVLVRRAKNPPPPEDPRPEPAAAPAPSAEPKPAPAAGKKKNKKKKKKKG